MKHTGTDHVYCIEVIGRDGVVKIGRAKNPEKRLRDLQTGSYDNLKLYHAEPVDRSISPQVEARARKDLERSLNSAGEKRNRTREMINKTTPEEGKQAIITAHHNIKNRNSV
jgi:hypothetical protein